MLWSVLSKAFEESIKIVAIVYTTLSDVTGSTEKVVLDDMMLKWLDDQKFWILKDMQCRIIQTFLSNIYP